VILYTAPFWYDIKYNYISTPFYANTTESQNRTVHYTFLFHTFILMNIFNQINCRKLSWDEVNVFNNFFNNKWFFFILIGEFVAQWFIVTIGGNAFRTTALTVSQHVACLLFGLGSLLVGVIGKKIPKVHEAKFNIPLNENDDGDDIMSKYYNRIEGKAKRSETMKLLDEN
jgi:hypothetical protein